jgi:hypothetical protein
MFPAWGHEVAPAHRLLYLRYFVIRTFLPAAIAFISLATAARAAVPIIGGPTYDASTMTGYQAYASPFFFRGDATAFDGFGRATLRKYAGSATANNVPVQFGNGTFTEFTTPSLPGTSRTNTSVNASNAAGVAVGTQSRFDSTGQNPAQQVLRWASPSQPTVLENGISGTTVGSSASGIDPLGTAVGTSLRFEADSTGFFTSTFSRPVRWSAGTTTATPLDVSAPGGKTANKNSGDTAGIDANGTTYGTVYTYAQSSNISGNFGLTAVRWNAGGTALTELAHAPAPANGFVEDTITRVRPNGFLAGQTEIHSGSPQTQQIPTRWSPDGSVTLLELPPDAVASSSLSRIFDLNDSGTAVGRVATKTTGFDGLRPVRWDAGTAAPTMLGLLGTPTDTTSAWALGVNSAGLAVGVQRPNSNSSDGIAVLWGLDGVAVDLNTLIDPTSGWRLIEADSITDSGYIAGVGMFDPDGTGPTAAYGRSFLIQVPEPTALAVVGVAALLVKRRRRA